MYILVVLAGFVIIINENHKLKRCWQVITTFQCTVQVDVGLNPKGARMDFLFIILVAHICVTCVLRVDAIFKE